MTSTSTNSKRVSGFLPWTLKPLAKADTGLVAGLRLAVKDLFDIQGETTGAGNPTWLASHAVASATHTSITCLLQQGAHFVGKTITDELAYSLNGQNKHYGTPTNPVTPERLPGGSSSGSAVVVAANQADIGLGTDTGGSIRVPASYNGLYGLRPTHGSISLDNMVGLAPSFDTVGWLTRSIEHMQQVTQCFFSKGTSSADNLKLGVLSNIVELASHGHLIKQWCEHKHVTCTSLPAQLLSQLAEAFRVLQGHEIWQEHGAWIKQYTPDFAEDIQQRIDSCKAIDDKQVIQAKQLQSQLNKQLSTCFEQFDVLVLPTTPGLAPLLTTPANELAEYRRDLLSMTAIAGLSGLPQLHLPLFTLHGAPCGLSFIGRKHTEMQLIGLAKTLGKFGYDA